MTFLTPVYEAHQLRLDKIRRRLEKNTRAAKQAAEGQTSKDTQHIHNANFNKYSSKRTISPLDPGPNKQHLKLNK